MRKSSQRKAVRRRKPKKILTKRNTDADEEDDFEPVVSSGLEREPTDTKG